MYSGNRSTLKETNFRQQSNANSNSLTAKISRNAKNDSSAAPVVHQISSSKPNKFFNESLVLQAQIRDAKMWSKYKCHQLELLFDLHAVIDSEFGVNEFGGITFTIRDATDSLNVTHYEIDCDMPDVKKGEWVRVGCTPRPWGYQVTSVQKAASGFLTGFYDKLVGSRLTLERKVAELNL